MKLSTRGKYGLNAMVYLASKAQEGPQPLRAIAQTNLLPDQYLEQLLGCLRKAGLVNTVRGAQGGYQLARPAGEITVGHIIDAMEGPLQLSECAIESEPTCPNSDTCPTRRVWEYLTDSINSLLYSISLQDMLETKEMDRFEPHLHG
ncbi:MAG: Rrf2 family transcriptional regulator [Clostridia bacterium]|nr:Rrf2 family transcriptional regulator [Clostridia bacterium]